MVGTRHALLHRPLFSRRIPLDEENAARRISAYVYGNILILTALIPVTTTDQQVGILVVVGTALSTFVAHAFAEGVGQAVREQKSLTREQRWGELRDSVPILSSAVLPAVILAVAWIGWLEPHTAQIAAEVAMLVRIGGIVFVIQRLKGSQPSRWTLLGAVLLTTVATVIVVLKVLLTH